MTNYILNINNKANEDVTRVEFSSKNAAIEFAERTFAYAGKLNFVKFFGGAVIQAENNGYHFHVTKKY